MYGWDGEDAKDANDGSDRSLVFGNCSRSEPNCRKHTYKREMTFWKTVKGKSLERSDPFRVRYDRHGHIIHGEGPMPGQNFWEYA
jgi:hypothetical protein